MAKKIRYNENCVCLLCHPHKQFKDGLSYGRHMVHFHKLKAEVYTKGRNKGYNTGWFVKK